MKNRLSLLACILVSIMLLAHRLIYPWEQDKPLKVTDWDALGYYMYLPAIALYHDATKLEWFENIDKKYAVSGGSLYQANKHTNGKYVFKYLGGVALIQAPLFVVAHLAAPATGYPADGFSPPYQYAIAFGVLLYVMLSLFLLRKILLRYFTDAAVAVTLLAVCLATNFIQYTAIDGGMSHAYIFPLYVLVLYSTIKWHENPRPLWAAMTGYIIGLATICRPTEAVMLFIPLFWNAHAKEAAAEKWRLVKQNRSHVWLAALFGLLGILPQLIYWEAVTGSWIYDVGSSWRFLTPFFRVLFGWEKGWFIYTPITIFFILGFFFLKEYPFRKSLIWFCLLNIYIIISWADWKYGGSYSTRALVQSYPVFALAMGAFLQKVMSSKWRIPFFAIGVYLIGGNIFQIWQYSQTVLHYNDMNRQYYSRIYLNPHPTPLDMSLMDTGEILENESGFEKKDIFADNALRQIMIKGPSEILLAETILNPQVTGDWLKVECMAAMPNGGWGDYLEAHVINGDSVKKTRIRMFNALTRDKTSGNFEFFVRVPVWAADRAFVKLYLCTEDGFQGAIESSKITAFLQ